MQEHDLSFVRAEMAVAQATPKSEAGTGAWLRKNLFSSVSDSVLAYFLPPFLEWAFLNAQWTGTDRTFCATVAQGGIQPDGWSGACWAFVQAKFGQFMFGRYPIDQRWRPILVAVMFVLLLVPLLMSYVIKIYAVRSILGLNGFLNKALVALGILSEPSSLFVFNMNAILLTLTLLLIPFAILPIFLALERIPQVLLRASDDLGASPLQTFLRVTLPLSLPGVASAASFVFVLALGDFLTPQMVGGVSGFTFGRILYSHFGTAYNWPFGAALSVALALLVIGAILLGERFGRSRGAST